jgi:1,4-alpha-glucan branching enzyme
VPRNDYVFNVPNGGRYRKILDSDARTYGGSQFNNQEYVDAVSGAGSSDWTVRINLPPLAAVFFSL